jgi:hypothetical protein
MSKVYFGLSSANLKFKGFIIQLSWRDSAKHALAQDLRVCQSLNYPAILVQTSLKVDAQLVLRFAYSDLQILF